MARMSLLVSTLVVLAVVTTVIGMALMMGILSLGPATAVATPTPQATFVPATPTPEVTLAPPTAEPPTAEPTPRPTAGGTHIVQPGESLSTIGLLYGVPWELIAEVNSIPEPYVIQVGQELLIPLAPDPTEGPTVHVVVAGDTIFSIAELYGVDSTELANYNNIVDWNLIFVGQRIFIPDPNATPDPDASPTP